MAKPISMDDRYRAVDRVGRVLKRYPLTPYDILQYLAVSSVRYVRIAIGFFFFLCLVTLPLWMYSGTPVGQVVAGYSVTLVVPAVLIVAHHYLSRLRDSACTSGPQPWLQRLNVLRWVFMVLAVVFLAGGSFFFYQKFTGSVLVGLSDLGMVYWYAGLFALYGWGGCNGVLAWLKLAPPSLPAPSQPLETLPPVVRGAYVVPDKLAAFRMSTRVVIVVVAFVVAVAVGVASVWWFVFRTPNGKGWTQIIAAGVNYDSVYDFGTPGVAVLSSGSDTTVTGVNLADGTTLWTRSGGVSVAGDATDVVAVSGSQLDVIDAATGTTKASVDLTQQVDPVLAAGAKVYWVGDGRLLYRASYTSPLCDAALDAPSNCIWTAPDSAVDLTNLSGLNLYVFGGGQYVNTGNGVLQMATGQPASFGADGGQRPSGTQGVYYTGPSPDRVLRVVPGSSDTSSYQPWDTTKDLGLSPAVTATNVLADPAASSYLALDSSGYSSLTAGTFYDWQTGQQQRQVSIASLYAGSTQFANGAWLAVIQRTKLVPVSVGLDPATGREIWHGRSNSQWAGVVGNIVYTSDGFTKLWAYDMTDGFKAAKSIGLPSQGCAPSVAGGRVLCLDRSSGSLWVLNP